MKIYAKRITINLTTKKERISPPLMCNNLKDVKQNS